MPEKASQYEKQEDAVASIQEQLKNSRIGNNVSSVTELGKNEKIKDATLKNSTNGEAAKLTVESSKTQMSSGEETAGDIEVNQNSKADADLNGERAPIAPYRNNTEKNKPSDEISSEEVESTSSQSRKKKRPRPEPVEKKPRPSSNEPKNRKRPEPSTGKAEQQRNTSNAEAEGAKAEKEKTEERPAIAKIISIGDPVLPDDIKSELESVGAWFLDNELDDEEEKDVRIIYKNPNGDVEGDMLVTWEQITPEYKTASEYKDALDAIIQAYHKAGEENNELYQHHLAQLALQVRHFAQIFHNKRRDDLESQVT